MVEEAQREGTESLDHEASTNGSRARPDQASHRGVQEEVSSTSGQLPIYSHFDPFPKYKPEEDAGRDRSFIVDDLEAISVQNASRRPRLQSNDLNPDVIVFKHKGITYPLEFPAFSIAEGEVKV